ncbi:GNAT family N-acetyltransferase [Brucepastera parasyntrophica]|uniref:GNAT family N-acetyltransferase n=1 Tax=Brucepastera parasyntrophica TaxID=2880008 RepID=UPI00210A55DF|nr:GNAT family N-acetyltransferase [Brucepastera parasyntrophica]ULQ61002.1 GNAT family N-acetyltransferase [Brucepastera parasyntrophica]
MSKNTLQNMHIRKLGPEDLEQYDGLLRYAFQVTEKTLLDYGWDNNDILQSKFPVLEKAQVLGFFDGDKLVSQFAVYPLKMNIHGNILDMGFITSVATYPEYTGMGFMSRLMKRSLEEMKERGQSISLLYPYSIPLYRHKGWEIISDKMTFHIKDTQLPKNISAPGYVRRVAEDSSDFMKLYRNFALKTHGSILRNDLAWEEYWRWDTDDTEIAVYYTADSRPTGYMVYMLKDDIMHIKEIVYLDVEAWKGLWKYIGAHDSMVDTVEGNNYSGESIAFWLEDSDIKETIRPYIMGRIIDVEKFLEQYHFITGNLSETISFIVKDDFLEWNNRVFTVRFDSGAVSVTRKEGAGKTVSLGIGTLTTLLLGYKRPEYLYTMERIKTDNETIALLEQIIPREKPNISDYF